MVTEVGMNNTLGKRESDERYSRQETLVRTTGGGQQALLNASVLVVGAGGLGCPVITALASAGIGRIGIVDKDSIEMTNLNRQYLYTPKDIGKRKAETAGKWVKRFRPDCQVDIYDTKMTEENVMCLLEEYHLILSALDTVSSRLLLNAAAVKAGKPLIDGAVDGFYGTVLARLEGREPCIACLNPEGRESGHKDSSFCPVTMMTGALQAQIALLYLTGSRSEGGVWTYDGTEGCIEEVPIKKNPDCKVCKNPVY